MLALRHNIGGIRSLFAPRLDPALRFTSVQQRVEQGLSAVVEEQALTKIVQQGEVESGIGQLQAQGILPIHAPAHGIGGLTVGEPFDILHDGGQGQAPGSGPCARFPHGRPWQRRGYRPGCNRRSLADVQEQLGTI